MHQNESMNNDIFYGNQRHALAGMSMIELLVALTVFSIALDGAIAAVNLIQKETSGFISTDQQTEQNNVDFASAFDNVSRKFAPESISFENIHLTFSPPDKTFVFLRFWDIGIIWLLCCWGDLLIDF